MSFLPPDAGIPKLILRGLSTDSSSSRTVPIWGSHHSSPSFTIFPSIQLNPPLMQLETFSFHLIAWCIWEETDFHHIITFFGGSCSEWSGLLWIYFSLGWTTPVPSLTLAKSSDPDLSQLHCPYLDTLQDFNAFPAGRSPKLYTVFKLQPHKRSVQENHLFLRPAVHTISDTSQAIVSCMWCPVAAEGQIHPP